MLLLLLFALLLIRPSIFGQTLTTPGVVFIFLLALVCFLFIKVRNDCFDKGFVVYVLIFWFCMLFFGVLGKSNLDFLIKAYIANCFVVLTVVLVFFRRRTDVSTFIGLYINLLAVLALSSIFTTFLFSFGYSVDELTIAELELGYSRPSRLLFPFSVLYHDMNTAGLNVLRFQSMFREAGIAQAFYLWAVAFSIFFRFNVFYIVTLLGGVLCSFSTAGIVIAIIVVPMVYFVRKLTDSHFTSKMIVSYISNYMLLIAILLPAAMYTLVYMPYFGVMQKLDSHQESVTDRLPNFEHLSFLGSGMYSSTAENAAINLIKGAETYGIFICVMYICFFTIFCWFNRSAVSGLKIFICMLPLFLTSLFSQPIVDAPLVYIALFLTRAALK